MTQLTAKREVFVQASPESVWRIHADIDAWHQWQPDITTAKLSGPIAVGGVFRWKSGGLAITSTIQDLEPNRKISWSGKAIGTQAHHSWTFRLQESGTTITTEESMEGWLVSLLKLVSPRFLDKSLDTWLRSLKAKAEASGNRVR